MSCTRAELRGEGICSSEMGEGGAGHVQIAETLTREGSLLCCVLAVARWFGEHQSRR